MASIFLFATSTITFTAAVFSIDQVFVSDCRVSMPCKIGIRQGLYWLYITTLSIFGATFLASVHCLLLLDNTLPLSYSINFSWLFSTLTTISIPYLVLNLGRVFTRVMKMHLHGMWSKEATCFNVNPGKVNTLWSGHVLDPSDNSENTVAIRLVNEHIRNDDRVLSVLLTISDGHTIAQKL